MSHSFRSPMRSMADFFFKQGRTLRPLLSHLLLCCALGTVLAGCGNSSVNVSLNGEMATPYHVHYDASVDRNPPQIYVKPNVSPQEPLRGLFVPLRITQNIAQPRELSRNLSRQIWQAWLAQQAFAALEYEDAVIPYKVSDALVLAQKRGANVLVGGYVTHYMDGGSVGDSSVSVAMEVYEVATGTLLWSMAQGGRMDKKQASDYFLVGVQSRMPADAVGLTARTLAHDMGMEIYYWVYPNARSSGSRGKAF